MQTDDRIQEILAQASQATAGGGDGTSDAGEDCFDANEYVRDLIARMSGDEDPAEVVRELQETIDPSNAAEASVPEVAEVEPVETAAPPLDVDGEDPFSRPRSQVLQPADLEQLREAANITSNSALFRSGCEDLQRRCTMNFLLAAISITLSLTLISLSTGRFSTAYFGSIGMVMIAGFATYRYHQASTILAQLARTKRGSVDDSSDDTEVQTSV